MVDRLVSVSHNTVTTSFMITPSNVLVHNGFLTEAGIIENFAQTAAAGIGAKPGIREGDPPVGFIGGIRHLTIHSYPQAGEEITTTITVEHEVFDASVVLCKLFKNNALMAECELKIFLIQ